MDLCGHLLPQRFCGQEQAKPNLSAGLAYSSECCTTSLSVRVWQFWGNRCRFRREGRPSLCKAMARLQQPPLSWCNKSQNYYYYYSSSSCCCCCCYRHQHVVAQSEGESPAKGQE